MRSTTQQVLLTAVLVGSASGPFPYCSSPSHYSKAQKSKRGGKKRGKGKPNAR